MTVTRKRIFRIFSKTLLGLVVLLVVLYAVLSAPYWWRHWFTYPALEKARQALVQQHQVVPAQTGLTDYQGVLHAHCYWSHDSRGVLSEILPAAKQAKLDFIFFSDHAHGGQDSFPRAYRGLYEGILLESGTERNGMMVSPMKDGVLNWDQEPADLIRDVTTAGGFVGYVHSEEAHDWTNPDYQAMEIYNIHTDLKDEKKTFLLSMVFNASINGQRYRHWAYRELFDEQEDILAHWDSLNQWRRIVGFAAVDAHNNQSFRARYTGDGLVEWVGPDAKTIKIVTPGWKERWLLHAPDTAGWAWKWEVDTYFASFNYVNTHVLCDTFSSRNIMDHLLRGHAYIAFENLAPAKGFQFFAADGSGGLQAVMGDSLATEDPVVLTAASPFPVQFTLLRNGQVLDQSGPAYNYQFQPDAVAGVYRLEARLALQGQWVPWVYTNPIYLYNAPSMPGAGSPDAL